MSPTFSFMARFFLCLVCDFVGLQGGRWQHKIQQHQTDGVAAWFMPNSFIAHQFSAFNSYSGAMK